MRLRRGKRLFRLVEHRYETTFAKATAVKDVDLEKRTEDREQKTEFWCRDHARALGTVSFERDGDFMGARH